MEQKTSTYLTLKKSACLMDSILQRVTGLGALARKVVINYALATHGLDNLDRFPLLVLRGPMGTGKSETLKVITAFAYRPNSFSLRGCTLPVVRDELAAAHNGTAVTEEADAAWKGNLWFEALISDRYLRASAKAAHKQALGDGQFETVHKDCFGATVLHRRMPFNDRALDGRSVFVRFYPKSERTYEPFREDDADVIEGRDIVRRLNLELPAVDPIPGVAPRIFDTYEPLLAVAQLCGDEKFPKAISRQLFRETAELQAAQNVEPDTLVLRSVIHRVALPDGGFRFRNVKLSEITSVVWDETKIDMLPQQAGAIARELGFEVKISHGKTVVAGTAPDLLRACAECNYSEDAITDLKKNASVMGEPGRAGSNSLARTPRSSKAKKAKSSQRGQIQFYPSLPKQETSETKRKSGRKGGRKRKR